LLIANYTPQTAEVHIEGLGRQAQLRLLDDSNALQTSEAARRFRSDQGSSLPTNAGALTLRMTPYCVARIDTE
jgi:hypothetical protein